MIVERAYKCIPRNMPLLASHKWAVLFMVKYYHVIIVENILFKTDGIHFLIAASSNVLYRIVLFIIRNLEHLGRTCIRSDSCNYFSYVIRLRKQRKILWGDFFFTHVSIQYNNMYTNKQLLIKRKKNHFSWGWIYKGYTFFLFLEGIRRLLYE